MATEWQLTLLAWAYWLAVGIALAGAGVMFRGWRARPMDQHPICRQCGYDLFGGERGQERCPECGADVCRPGAVMIGHRTRHKPMIYIGVTIMVLFACGAYLADWRYDVIRNRPMLFVQAVQNANLQELDRLLALHPAFARGQYYANISSSEPTHMAITVAGSDQVLQRLLLAGADPNATEGAGTTALELAVRRLRQTSVHLLVQAGADLNRPGRAGELPLPRTHGRHCCGPDAQTQPMACAVRCSMPIRYPWLRWPVPAGDLMATEVQ